MGVSVGEGGGVRCHRPRRRALGVKNVKTALDNGALVPAEHINFTASIAVRNK